MASDRDPALGDSATLTPDHDPVSPDRNSRPPDRDPVPRDRGTLAPDRHPALADRGPVLPDGHPVRHKAATFACRGRGVMRWQPSLVPSGRRHQKISTRQAGAGLPGFVAPLRWIRAAEHRRPILVGRCCDNAQTLDETSAAMFRPHDAACVAALGGRDNQGIAPAMTPQRHGVRFGMTQ